MRTWVQGLGAAALSVGCASSPTEPIAAARGVEMGRVAYAESVRVDEKRSLSLQSAAERVGAERGDAGRVQELLLDCSASFSFVVRVSAEGARVFLPGRERVLPRIQSDYGVKFSDGVAFLWMQEDAAIFDDEEGRRFLCSSSDQITAQRGG
jgi:hypothetical protein